MAERLTLKYETKDAKLNMALRDIIRKINDKVEWILAPTFTTVKLEDTDATHHLTLKWNEDETVLDRILNFKVNASDRTVDLSGNLTTEAATTLDQDYTSDATVRFAKLGLGMDAVNVLDVTGDSGLDGAVTINEAGAAKDTRIEGLNKTHLFFVDASTDFVGINEPNPVCRVHITGTACADYAGVGADTMLLIENNDNVAIHLQATTTGVAFIEFCDDNYNPPAGRVGYDFANEQIEFVVGTNEHMWLTTTQLKTDLSNFELSGAGAQIKFTGTAGGNGEGILYKDSGGLARYGLLFGATNKVVLCNRAANGTVELRANTSTAGDAGEVTVVTVEDDNVTFGQTFTGITGSTIGTLTLADGSITDSSNAIDFGNEVLSTTSTIAATTAKLSDLTDGYLPYHVSDASGLANSPVYTDGTGVGINETTLLGTFHVDIGTGGVQGGLVLDVSAENAGEAQRYGSIDFISYTTGLVGQFFLTANTYANAGANLPVNSLGVFAEHADGSLVLYAAGASGDIRLGTGGYALANEQMRIDENGNVGVGTYAFGTNAVGVYAQGTGTAPTTSPANAFQMYSADIGGAAGKAGAHFRDEEGNIVSIGSGGLLLTGTARYYWGTELHAMDFKAPAAGAATQVNRGMGVAWSFADGNEESIHTQFRITGRWVDTEDLTVILLWSSPTVSGNCDWEVRYLFRATNEDMTTAAPDGTTTDIITSSGTANGLMHSSLTIPTADFASGDKVLFIEVFRDGNDDADTLGAAAYLHGMTVRGIANKLGGAT